MKIAKPFRLIFAVGTAAVVFVLALNILKPFLGRWAILVGLVAIPFSYLLGEAIINVIDSSLRKWSKDPIWVAQHPEEKDE